MTFKATSCRIFLLLCLGYLISDFTFCQLTESEVSHIRQKRSIICIFGLTNLLKQSVYVSLIDIHKYDPLPLGNTEEDEFEDGVLKGLSTLKNLTELNVYCNEDRVVVLETTLGMRNAEILYHWTREFLFTFSGKVWMRARKVNLKLEVHMNTTRGLSFKVVNTLVTKLEKFQFGISGLGPLNPLVKGLVHVMYEIWNKKVTTMIEGLLKETLEKKLQEVSHTFDFLKF